MKQNILHIGLDVDDTQYHGSALNQSTGENETKGEVDFIIPNCFSIHPISIFQSPLDTSFLILSIENETLPGCDNSNASAICFWLLSP